MSGPSSPLRSIGTSLIRIEATQTARETTGDGFEAELLFIRNFDRRHGERDSVERHARIVIMLRPHAMSNQLNGIH